MVRSRQTSFEHQARLVYHQSLCGDVLRIVVACFESLAQRNLNRFEHMTRSTSPTLHRL